MRLTGSLILVLFVAIAGNAAASSVSGNYRIGCLAGTGAAACFPGGVGIFNIDSTNRAYTSPNYSLTQDLGGQHFAGAASMSYDLEPDNLHAYLSTSATIQNPGSSDTLVSYGFAALDATVTDALHFSSSSLAPGTDVAFTVTGVLHSEILSDFAGCTTDGPSGYATMSINGVGFPFGPNTWYHSTCGDGSDFMEATGTFHSTVGGNFGLTTHLLLKSNSSVEGPNSGTYFITVDAEDTAALYVNVLTPGVTFNSDSGATFSAPEPATVLLILPLLGAFLARLRWATDDESTRVDERRG